MGIVPAENYWMMSNLTQLETNRVSWHHSPILFAAQIDQATTRNGLEDRYANRVNLRLVLLFHARLELLIVVSSATGVLSCSFH